MPGLLDRLYLASPIWLQSLGVAAWGLWWRRRRFGPRFAGDVATISARDRWSAADLRVYQEERLAAVLAAAGRSPYYRRVFAAAGVEEGAPPFATLARLPPLTKEDLRVHGRELLTAEPDRGTMVFRSSGTTGTPTEIFFPAAFHRLVQAFFEARNRAWAGVTHRDRRAMFGVRKVCRPDQSRPPYWRRSPAEDLTYFSIYHLDPGRLPAYVEHLQKLRPRVVMGYPNALATLARFVVERGLELPAAKAVITTSETVTEEIRAVLEAAWGCRVFDQYCAVEACVLATQCEHGRYHVSPDFALLEVIDAAGRPCPPGVPGRAICTGLHNELQPLLRYEIGDTVAWSLETACPCGREMPMLASIEGRIEDVCVTPDGREIVRFDTVFKGIRSIREGQIEQQAIDRFVVRVVPTPDFSDADRRRLVANLRLHVGSEVEAVVETVDAIPRTAAGKFRPVISRCAPTSRSARRPEDAQSPLA